MEIFRVAFIGHREVRSMSHVERELEKILSKMLLEKEFVECYIGRNGDFDIIAASVIKRVQREYGCRNCELILVLPYSVKDEKDYEKYYDDIWYPLPYDTHFKEAITKRNQWMIDNANLLIAFVEEPTGGAYKTLQYAQKKNVEIINLAPNLS